MIIVGIDPGLHGALVALDDQGTLVASTLMPTSKGKRESINPVSLFQWLSELEGDEMLYIEQPQPSPGRTSFVATLAIGEGIGRLQAMCEMTECPYEMVTPHKWKRAIIGNLKKTADPKAATIEYVRRRWPSLNLTPGKRTKPHDGLADACAIAEYGRRLIVGGKEHAA